MTKLKLTEKLQKRQAETAAERICYCASMLYLHDFLSTAERKNVHKRMMKWKERDSAKSVPA